MSLPAERIAVIVGVGEITERLREATSGSEPLALMEQALRAAEQDSGASLLVQIDSLDIVAEHSWPYVDAPGLLSQRLGISPRHAVYGETGGESPVRFMHQAALRIQSGESSIAAVVGAEAAYTVAAARKAGIKLEWPARDRNAKLVKGADLVHPIALRNGVDLPTHVYPFYENAAQAHWGQNQAQALQESGEIWSAFSEVAASNPYAWIKKPLSAEQITTPTEQNRLIAWPYTKSMVANPLVNQGAAVLLTSLAKARELGIKEDRLIYLLGGASANEPRDYLQRDQYWHSHAQDAVMQAARELVGGSAAQFSLIELYSCFPCVPKMARRSLDLPADAPLSVTGGLSLFGAPLNNYMGHAAAALVRALRQRGNEATALLYGQGEYVTKHHALVMSRQPPLAALSEQYSVQARADAARGPVPKLLESYSGPAVIETFTVVYGREGSPEFGTVIARTPADDRVMARVPASDLASLARLTDLQAVPVGTPGEVTPLEEGLLAWRLI